ncbi:MAG: ATP-binding protein [Gammaproteobacteria bacterium]|nr:ATP-binding protein [Gammaproteobacteria bacterium]
MRLPRPRTLFGRTLATIALVSVGFQIFTLAVIALLLLMPLGQRSADDLAALMLKTVAEWRAAADPAAYAEQLLAEDGLVIVDAHRSDLPPSGSWLPYRHFLEQALEQRTGMPLTLLTSLDGQGQSWFWADLPTLDGPVRVGFARTRIGVQPPVALILVLSVGAWVTLLTAIALVRRLTAPLERLSGAAKRLGAGDWPEPVPEQGPEELASLATSFNRMVRQVRELVANRTTLLAGISHDLRTPMTQIQLALAMLPGEGGDPELMAGIRRDLDNMNRLIAQFLEISRELEGGGGETVEVGALLADLVTQFGLRGTEVTGPGCSGCRHALHALALRRVVANLLENAVRYGDGAPVEVTCRCDAGAVEIRVLDRGPGIPAEQLEAVFRPFYRLEGSRSSTTGGSGLGLAVVRQLASANGWGLRLEPREGGGMAAVVSVPLETKRTAAQPAAGR